MLRDNPSLRPRLPDLMRDAHLDVRLMAERETGLDESIFPADCPWDGERILSDGFLPE